MSSKYIDYVSVNNWRWVYFEHLFKNLRASVAELMVCINSRKEDIIL